MVDYVALKAEIAKPDYSGMDAATIAAALNAKTVIIMRPIPAREITKMFGKTGVLAKAKLFADNAANDLALRVACLTVYDALLHDLFTDIDPNDPQQSSLVNDFLDALEKAGCLDDTTRAAVLGLAEQSVPFLETVGAPLMDDESLAFHVEKTLGIDSAAAATMSVAP